MPEIRFYHLTRRTAEQALPELVTRAYGRGLKTVIRCADEAEASRLNDHLWTFHPDSFLPHGTAKDGPPERQPVFLTQSNDNPSGATVLILMPGASTESIEDYTLCCTLLDGHNEPQVASSRELWKAWKAQGHTMTYWQQSDQGKWEQKA